MLLKKTGKNKKNSLNIPNKEKLKYLVPVPGIILSIYAAGFIGALIDPNTATGMDFGFFPTLRRALTTKAGWTGIIIMLLAIGALFLYLWVQAKLSDTDERNVKRSQNGTYGTSWFMDEKELAETFAETDYAAETDGIILGTSLDSGKIVSIPIERGKNRNIAISGAQGSMKSVAFSRPMIMQAVARGASIFCTDPKSELTEDAYYYLKSEGYRVYVWNLIDMVNSDSWDILAESEGEKYMDVLCDVIIKNTLDGDDPDHFYDGIEKDLLKALCYYVYTVKPTGKRTIGEAYNMLITYSADELDRIFDDLRKTDPENPAIGPYMLFAKAPNSKGNAILGLGTRLGIFMNPLVKRITSTPGIDLASLAREKTAIFCVTSDQDSTYDVLAATLVSMTFIKTVRFADSQPDRMCIVPIEFILDEMPSIGEIPDMGKKLATARSRDIGVTMIFQNLPQMQKRYPQTDWENLLSGCDYRIMLGCNDTTTSNYFSELTGMATIEVSTERKTLGTIRLTDYTPQYAESKGEGQRPVMFEDEVRRMDDTQLLLIVRGKKPIRLKKFGYYNHTEALKFRQVKTSEIVPPWRIYQGEDVLTGEKIESNDEFLLRVSKDDSRLVVKNSKKYGSQRALLERDLAEIKKRRKKRGFADNTEQESFSEDSQLKEQKQEETDPDMMDSNMQSVIPGHDPYVDMQQKSPVEVNAETDIPEETETVSFDTGMKEPGIPDVVQKTERAEQVRVDPVMDMKESGAKDVPVKNNRVTSVPAVEPETVSEPKPVTKGKAVPELKNGITNVRVRERKSNLSQLKKRDELKADDYLSLLSKNNRR